MYIADELAAEDVGPPLRKSTRASVESRLLPLEDGVGRLTRDPVLLGPGARLGVGTY
jgi:hypothetical protein